MKPFHPDLVVEVTSACNRACKGCYAPNIVSKLDGDSLMKANPGLFIDIEQVKFLVDSWGIETPKIVSVRGGEPSLHPHLSSILSMLKDLTGNVILETHGRWLLSKNRDEFKELIGFISTSSITIKISFDSMHGLGICELREITDFLESNEILYLVAITEINEEEFQKTRDLCPWIISSNIIYQKKSLNANDLISPHMGVISVSGELKGALNSRFLNNFSILEAVI